MTRLRHVGITVTDANRSLKLYKDYFGFKVFWDEIEQGGFIDSLSGLNNIKVRTIKLRNESGVIELLQYLSHPKKNVDNFLDNITKVGCSHLALTVPSVDETYGNLKKLGLQFNDVPKTSPCGKAKVCFCRDFDGTLIELVEELKK